VHSTDLSGGLTSGGKFHKDALMREVEGVGKIVWQTHGVFVTGKATSGLRRGN